MGYEIGKLVGYPLAQLALGAATTIGSSYIASRLGEKQAIDARLERLEKIVDQMAKEQKPKSKKR